MKTLVFRNIAELVTMQGAAQKLGRNVNESDLHVTKGAAFIVSRGQICWVGTDRKLSTKLIRQVSGQKAAKDVDLKGRTVVPGFVEGHTHLVFAGDRAQEFEWRNQGVSYQEIAAKGGGIRSTMTATRKAPRETLRSLAQTRADIFVHQGVTTLEVKSGYGLSLEAERKCLAVAGELKGPEIVRTFLGPHSLPPEFAETGHYIDYLIETVLPVVVRRKLAERVDIFIEKGFFTAADAAKWFKAARGAKLEIVAHVDQLSSGGGASLAAMAGAVSVDHCIHLSKDEMKVLARSQTTAVLLPTSDFYLRVDYPRARELIDCGVRVALATDFNPGTSPTQDLSLVGVLARLEMKMSQAEVLCAYTVGGAHALNRASRIGSIEIGKRGDFAVVDGSWRDLFYRVGHHPIIATWRSGIPISTRK